jgi:hypothetical protein
MLRHLRLGVGLRAVAIAASSAEYGFCSVRLPIVDEKVSNPGPPCAEVCVSITPPIPTTPFHAEQLTAIRVAESVLACSSANSLTMVVARVSQDANVNGVMVSRLSMGISFRAFATW